MYLESNPIPTKSLEIRRSLKSRHKHKHTGNYDQKIMGAIEQFQALNKQGGPQLFWIEL